VIMRTHSVTVLTIKIYERLRYLCRHVENSSTTPTVMSPAGLGIENICAGDGQQQFTRLADCSRGTVVGQKNIANKSAWTKTKSDCAGEGQQQLTRANVAVIPGFSYKERNWGRN
jgi:hypothetical protein